MRRLLFVMAVLIGVAIVLGEQEPPTTRLNFRLFTISVEEARRVLENFGAWKPKGLKYHGVSAPVGPPKASPFNWCYLFTDQDGWLYWVNWTTGRLAECEKRNRVFEVYESAKEREAVNRSSLSPEGVLRQALSFLSQAFPENEPVSWEVHFSLVKGFSRYLNSGGGWRPDASPMPIVFGIAYRALGEGARGRLYPFTSLGIDRHSGEVLSVGPIGEPPPAKDVTPAISEEAVRKRVAELVNILGPLFWKGATGALLKRIEGLWLVNYRDDLGLRRVAWLVEYVGKLQGERIWDAPYFEEENDFHDFLLVDATTGWVLCDTKNTNYGAFAVNRHLFGSIACTWEGGEIALAYPVLEVAGMPYIAAQYLSSFGYAMNESPTDLRFSDRLEQRGKPPLHLSINVGAKRVDVLEGTLKEKPFLQQGVVYLHLRDFASLTWVRFFFSPKTGVDILWKVPLE